MSRMTIRYTSFRRLAGNEALTSTILRLMMACNDLGLADHSLKLWHGEHETRKRRQVGAKMYFVRLEIAHMFEAFSIIQHIRDNADLSQAVLNCDRRTRQSFGEVVQAIDSDDWKKMLRIRNNITFHYGESVTKKAFKTAVSSYPDTPWEISLGDLPIDWFFEPADRIVDRIVVRDIFEIPPDADMRTGVDEIVVRLQLIIEKFVDFAGYFIWHYTKL